MLLSWALALSVSLSPGSPDVGSAEPPASCQIYVFYNDSNADLGDLTPTPTCPSYNIIYEHGYDTDVDLWMGLSLDPIVPTPGLRSLISVRADFHDRISGQAAGAPGPAN